jgi:hypothetical protein
LRRGGEDERHADAQWNEPAAARNLVLRPLTEGVTLNVPGIQNLNHSNGGDNRYVQIS